MSNTPLTEETYKRLVENNYQELRPKQERKLPEPVERKVKPAMDSINRIKGVGVK